MEEWLGEQDVKGEVQVLVGMMATAMPVPELRDAGGRSGGKDRERDWESKAPPSQMGIWTCGLVARDNQGRRLARGAVWAEVVLGGRIPVQYPGREV